MTDSPVPSERAALEDLAKARQFVNRWGFNAKVMLEVAGMLGQARAEERYGCAELAESYGDVEIADAIRSRSKPAGGG